MRNIPAIVRTRRQRRQKLERRPAGRIALACSTLLSLLLVGLFVGLASAYLELTRGLPSVEALPVLLEPPGGVLLEPTRLYDRGGEHILLSLENPAAAGKKYLPIGASDTPCLPTALISATIATADPGFWNHAGYTLDGWQNGTHPTLAQRLVAELLLWDEPAGLRRNLRERLLAAQITRRFGRRKVLEWYLNSAHYGRLVYGADAAARVYLNKSASQLNLAEAALLAAVAEAPAFNPHDAPQQALERQQQVIRAMLLQGLVTAEQAQEASQATIVLALPVEASNPAPAFTELVLAQVAESVPLSRLERGGFRVITSLDYELQLQTSCTVAAYLAAQSGVSVELTTFDGRPCQAARWLPATPSGPKPTSPGLSAAVLILDPHSGQILAMSGDPLADHPAGTLLTPFVYLTAFSRGFSPATLIWDVPPATTGEAALPTTTANPDGQYHGPMRLRTALGNDYLAPTAQILAQIGADNVVRTLQQFGLTPVAATSADGQSLAFLQESPLTLTAVVQAYSIFANQGILSGRAGGGEGEVNELQPAAALQLTDANGKVLADWNKAASKAVLSPQLAYLMTHVLSDEATRWQSLGHPNPLEIGRPAGAKLGATPGNQDAWAVGFTPQMVVGVWLGYPRGTKDAALQPLGAAALWHAVIQYASRELTAQGWPMPPGVTALEVCDPSGMLPTAYCPRLVSEVFLAGSEPTQADTLYQVFQINRQTGRLATVFTPPELVEERVYLVAPPLAAVWAQQAGLPTPPDSYDTLYLAPSASPQAHIRSPQLFANVNGLVEIIGSAEGDDFAFYRLQVGQGLNPQHWIQIGQDTTRHVHEDLLGVWDTSGLSGLYAVQLLVVRKDQRVETFTTPLTVDNRPPEIHLLQPLEGQAYTAGASAIFQAETRDDVAVASVEFYVDDERVVSISQPPFTIAWKAQKGVHRLRVRALDLAGNMSEAALTFVVQ